MAMAAPQTNTRSFLKLSPERALWMTQLADTKASILMSASAILAGRLVRLSSHSPSLGSQIVRKIERGWRASPK